MKDQNLIAALALFGELYNEKKKKITDIIADFILNAINLRNKISFNSREIKTILKEEYGFDILESVVRTTLNGLANKNVLKKMSNEYILEDNKLSETSHHIADEIKKNTNKQEIFFDDLCSYVEEKRNESLTKEKKDILFTNFISFLLDRNSDVKDKELISSFIVSKENNSNTQEILTSIKEGVILYQGITYTDNINELGSWKNKLTIYLATEHLFSAVGYNEELYQEIFSDFLSLVNEINNHSKDKKKKIYLVYGDETHQEVDKFFSTAENIKRGSIKADNILKPAMKSILEGCNSPSDIVTKKSNFIKKLKEKGIERSPNTDIKPEYNVEDLSTIKEVIEKSEKKINEEDCLDILKIFSHINTKRAGKECKSFEQAKYIYMVDSNLANYLSHQYVVKIKADDFPFAKNIDFVVTQLWFKLNKGFNLKNQSLPKSFSFITKAKLILSNSVSKSIESRYDEIKEKVKKGDMGKDDLILLKDLLEKEIKKPEDITYENIDDTYDFLNNNDFVETKIRENSLKDAKNKKLEEENAVLQNYKDTEEAKKRKKQINKEAKKYAYQEWKKQIKNDRKNILYFIKWISLDILFIGLSIAGGILSFQGIFGLSPWVSLLVIILLIPIYVFHKYKIDMEKIKLGYSLIFKYKEYKKYKTTTLIDFRNKYRNENI